MSGTGSNPVGAAKMQCSSEAEHSAHIGDVRISKVLIATYIVLSSNGRTCGFGPQSGGSSPPGTTIYGGYSVSG